MENLKSTWHLMRKLTAHESDERKRDEKMLQREKITKSTE